MTSISPTHDLSAPPIYRPAYVRFAAASFGRALIMLIRRRRAILAVCFTLFPVIIPLATSLFYPDPTAVQPGHGIFVMLMKNVYLDALAPLLALFFATMLVGEEVETNSMPYLLTRPIPRTALIVGKFVAYVIAVSALVIPGMFLSMVACTTLAEFSLTGGVLTLFAHYVALMVLSLASYGAVCMCFGALLRYPIIIGAGYIFGWQRLMAALPGLLDFSTIEKYIRALLPALATERAKPTATLPIGQFVKSELAVRPVVALTVLFSLIVLFIVLSALTLRWREYTNARAVDGS